jgi:hypothetical protein
MSWVITGSQKVNWTPSLISTALWLDAADASTVTTVSGAVSQWNDKSGNERNATQATSNRRPAYTSSGLNGKNVLTFADDFLSNASVNWGDSASSVFIVSAATGAGTFRNIIATGTGLTNQWGYGITNANAYAIFQIAVGSQAFSVTPSITDILCFTSAGRVSTSVSATLTTNGTLNGTQTRSGAGLTSTAGIIIGSNNSVSEPFTGFIGEVVLVPEIVSTSTRQQMEGYLAHKWGLTANLPADHPYKVNVPVP